MVHGRGSVFHLYAGLVDVKTCVGCQVARELSRVAPINLLRPSCRPWIGGAISLNAVVDRLSDLLPPRFEDLEKVRHDCGNAELTAGLRSSGG